MGRLTIINNLRIYIIKIKIFYMIINIYYILIML